MSLILLRHGFAQPPSFNHSDFDRPLSSRGKLEIELLAQKLHNFIPQIDYCLSSSALRTQQTAKLIEKHYHSFPKIALYKSLYNCDLNNIDEHLSGLDFNKENILLIAHNPALSFYTSALIKEELALSPGEGVIYSSYQGPILISFQKIVPWREP